MRYVDKDDGIRLMKLSFLNLLPCRFAVVITTIDKLPAEVIESNGTICKAQNRAFVFHFPVNR